MIGGKTGLRLSVLVLAVIFGIELRNYGQKNNSCTDFVSYFNIANNDSCFYNPDAEKDTPQLLEKYFEKYETFNVTTEDGYILTMYHVPREGAKGVVVLYPPASADAVVWMGQSNESFAVILHKAGYDVWLPNHRGTKYSMGHLNQSLGSSYWDFSFHEIALYDYPAFTKLIKNQTGRSDLIFIGHSMSATAGVVYAALKPKEVLDSYKVMIHSCPPVYYKYSTTQHQIYERIVLGLTNFLKFIGYKGLFTPGSILEKIYKLPKNGAILKYLAHYLVLINSGWTSNNQLDPKYVSLLFNHLPRGISLQLIEHYRQFVPSKKFHMFDYGPEKNLELYNSSEPLEYPIQDIVVPTYLVFSTNDIQSSLQDSYYLYDQLNEKAKIYGYLKLEDVNHVGIFYGINRYELIHSKIIDFMDKIIKN